MKALLFERSLPRFAAARVASEWRSGSGARVGPIRLTEIDRPVLPSSDWRRVRPILSGICGSDLATIDGRSSRYFEPLVSFPFVPGHEVVGEADDGRRVVLEPVLRCAARGIESPCPPCAAGLTNRCQNVAFGHLKPGLQTGYCSGTGGGWGTELIAHDTQLHEVPDGLSDRAAVMVEPAACAVHGALAGPRLQAGSATAVVIGAGTLGLCTVAALSRYRADIGTVLVVAKYEAQRRSALDLGATAVVEPAELGRSVRRRTASLMLDSGQLTGGASVVFDCVGSSRSLSSALSVIEPGGNIVLLGMPGEVKVDLTGLWQREVSITGAYAYGTEHLAQNGTPPTGTPPAGTPPAGTLPAGTPPAGTLPARTFDLAFDLVGDAGLDRLVSALYPLNRYREAIEHAAAAGRRGAVKVAFDLRSGGSGRSRRFTLTATSAPTATAEEKKP